MPDNPKHRTTIGGQAVMEGIMMRGPQETAVIVRCEDGTLSRKDFPPSPKRKAGHPLKWPLVRGVYVFGSSLRLGYKALDYSASIIPEVEPDENSKIDRWLSKFNAETVQKVVMTIAMVLAVILSVGLFFLLPTLLTGWIGSYFAEDTLPWVKNITEGGVRLLILLGWLTLASRMKDMKRVFAYHGAEHKVIACYEAGEPLTLENAQKQSRRHPRCGTSFLLVVVIVSVLVFSLVSWSNPWVRMGLRLALLPVVVAVSYELNRLVGRYDNPVTRFFRAPGLWLQGLTTREPEDGMVEVGIEALKAVLPEEQGADKW